MLITWDSQGLAELDTLETLYGSQVHCHIYDIYLQFANSTHEGPRKME